MDEKIWLEQVSEKIKKKMLPVTEKSKGKVPYTTKDGVFDLVDQWLLGRFDVADVPCYR